MSHSVFFHGVIAKQHNGQRSVVSNSVAQSTKYYSELQAQLPSVEDRLRNRLSQVQIKLLSVELQMKALSQHQSHCWLVAHLENDLFEGAMLESLTCQQKYDHLRQAIRIVLREPLPLERDQHELTLKLFRIDFGLFVSPKIESCVKQARKKKSLSNLQQLIELLKEAHDHAFFTHMKTREQDMTALFQFETYYKQRLQLSEEDSALDLHDASARIFALVQCVTHVKQYLLQHNDARLRWLEKCRKLDNRPAECQLLLSLKELIDEASDCQSSIGQELIQIMLGVCGDGLDQCDSSSLASQLDLFD